MSRDDSSLDCYNEMRWDSRLQFLIPKADGKLCAWMTPASDPYESQFNELQKDYLHRYFRVSIPSLFFIFISSSNFQPNDYLDSYRIVPVTYLSQLFFKRRKIISSC